MKIKYIISLAVALILAGSISIANGETNSQTFEKSGIKFTIATDIDTTDAENCLNACSSQCLETKVSQGTNKDYILLKERVAQAKKMQDKCMKENTSYKRAQCVDKNNTKIWKTIEGK